MLRPGGLELTTRLLATAQITGVDSSSTTSAPLQKVVAATGGKLIVADAADTGLNAGSADVIVGAAMLTMQGDNVKKSVVGEAFRVLRPDGRYVIHESGLTPDDLADVVKGDIRREMARAIKVNARPLTVAEWTELLTSAEFEVVSVDRAPMALLQPRRVIADEGALGALRIVANVLTHPAARKRVLRMRKTFNRYRAHLAAVAIVAVVPAAETQ